MWSERSRIWSDRFRIVNGVSTVFRAFKPVPGHLGISFAFGAFTVALACQKLLLLRCYLRPSGSYQPYGKFQPRCPCKCLGLHFKWCKYLMPSEVISRMESPSQDALASLAIKVQLSFFFTQVDYYHLDIKYLEPIGTLYIIYYILVLPHDFCHLSPVI